MSFQIAVNISFNLTCFAGVNLAAHICSTSGDFYKTNISIKLYHFLLKIHKNKEKYDLEKDE